MTTRVHNNKSEQLHMVSTIFISTGLTQYGKKCLYQCRPLNMLVHTVILLTLFPTISYGVSRGQGQMHNVIGIMIKECSLYYLCFNKGLSLISVKMFSFRN